MITRISCRVCSEQLEPILSLGNQYVSNFIDPGETDGIKAPLELTICRKCKLVQLKHTIPGEHLYQNYWYRSGTNQTMRKALAEIAHTAELLIHLNPGDAVLDIGCNDGTLLNSYSTKGIYKIGFDPAQNLAEFSEKVVNTLISDYFNFETYNNCSDLQNRYPKIITSIAMFYDLENPNKFVSDIKKVMHKDGLWIVQMSYLPLMLKQNEFGNICHEHLEYYSLQSLEYLLTKHNFEIVDGELNDVNGGSIRIYIRNKTAKKTIFGDATYRKLARERIIALREQEKKLGLGNIKTYLEFAIWIDRIKHDVVEFIRSEIAKGKTVYVYGASTKGNTVLQYFELDNTLITAAAERNPDKWGKLTVGTHIPIISEDEARAAKPDYFLVLPWHFIEEFKEREKEFLLQGGRFILPAPNFSLI
jgi:NDP-4-keto-2,6-dideoxyhexose 3-C-methyltransferase